MGSNSGFRIDFHEVAIVCFFSKNTETRASLQYVEIRPVDFKEPVNKKKMFWEQFLPLSGQLSSCLKERAWHAPISLSLSLFFFKPNLKAVLFFFEENKTSCANVVYIASWAVGGRGICGTGGAGSWE